MIDEDAEADPSFKTNSITICSECKVPSNRYDNTVYDILRAHPHCRPGHYHENNLDAKGTSWHDWVEVEYDVGGDACGKVLLWCWIEFTSEEVRDQSYAMVETLSGQGKKLDEITVLDTFDVMVAEPHQIQFIPCSAIKSVVYVLPSIDHNDTNRCEYNKYFCDDLHHSKHFMVINPVELWK